MHARKRFPRHAATSGRVAIVLASVAVAWPLGAADVPAPGTEPAPATLLAQAPAPAAGTPPAGGGGPAGTQTPALPEVVVEPPEAAASAESPPATPASSGTVAPLSVLGTPAAPGRSADLLGVTSSASAGLISQEQLGYRPLLRPGEALETIPGLVVTQHSGTGKANQYFLRGFNLDHGTDFSLWVDGVPINLPTHAHGQGYLDVNFLVPELIETIEFRKGPYYAEVGDFSSAGAARIRLVDRLDRSIVRVTGGENDFWRLLVADSSAAGPGELLTVWEMQFYDGPWDVSEDFEKYNGLLKYTVGDELTGMSITAGSYRGLWTSTDQIPLRAVNQGLIGRLGTIDATDGGQSSRVMLNAELWDETADQRTEANLYLQYYTLDLFSNFTYFLDDPVNGDQFSQVDRRWYGGANVSRLWAGSFFGRPAETKLGAQLRSDRIPVVALRRTAARTTLSTVREDQVTESSLGLFGQYEAEVFDYVRPTLGLRGDAFHFDVESRELPENSGATTKGIISPKAGVAFGPWASSEAYLNWGLSFHSNDARGVTIRTDPVSGLPADSVPGLVRSQGEEVGFRSELLPGLTSTLAFWQLDLDSELLFVGDAGTTEASRPSRRQGIEWTNFYQWNEHVLFDADFAWTDARFTDGDPAGDQIPGAISRVISFGPTFRDDSGWFTTVRYRYFGPRPLVEDDSVRSGSTTLVQWRVGYERRNFQAALDVFNLLDSDQHDIDYFYTSRLPGEPAGGVDDLHFHPVEPITARFTLTWLY